MIKPQMLKKGDKVAIVSLSKGILGEPFIKHELDIALDRLKNMGLVVEIMPNALKGMDYLDKNPKARAEDLKDAFKDNEIKAIITAIGGNDTYRLLPYLMEDEEFITNVKNNPKIFMGFSDTTVNHLMFYRLGLTTFYGPAIVTDFAELDNNMLPYTEKYINNLFNWSENTEIESSSIWYRDRESYKPSEIGTSRIVEEEKHGFEVLNGNGIIEGSLFGGCIDTFNDILRGRFDNQRELCLKYKLIPNNEELKDKILFLETSEMKMTPEELSSALNLFKEYGLFNNINGVILGKPIDEVYYDEYKNIYMNFFKDNNIPALYNVNFGHATPRCIIPYGVKARVDLDNKKINIIERPFSNNI